MFADPVVNASDGTPNVCGVAIQACDFVNHTTDETDVTLYRTVFRFTDLSFGLGCQGLSHGVRSVSDAHLESRLFENSLEPVVEGVRDIRDAEI